MSVVESLLPLVSFVFVASITPGPNNLMLAASGIGFGLRRTLPHIAGIAVGFAALLVVCALGTGALIAGIAGAGLVMQIAGSAYLVYLAVRLGSSRLGVAGAGSDRPLSFAGAAAFQFINPKAWMMALTCAGVFLPGLGNEPAGIMLLALIGTMVNLPCVSLWAVAGSTIRMRLADPRWQRRCTIGVVALTLYAAVAVWL